MSNPVFRKMSEARTAEGTIVLDSEPMTVSGSINKTFILFALLFASSICTWTLFFQGAIDKVGALTMIGFVASIIAFIVIMFNQNALRIAAPLYAISEGLLLGGISAQFERIYPGIAIQAVAATFMALFSMLFLYRIQAIRCTEKFRSTILIATLAICGVYVIDLIGSFFGLHVPLLYSGGILGIGISLVICVIAALNLIMDFEFIEQGASRMLPKNMEWYGAFGLMVTMVWLYIEILNLLAKLNRNN